MVYVEEIQDGQSQLSLMQTAPGSSGTALQQVDSLSVYVFEPSARKTCLTTPITRTML